MTSRSKVVLDRAQLRELTPGDTALRRQVMELLLEDTRKQVPLLAAAIERGDAGELRLVARYCRGACDELGALSSAAVLRRLEQDALRGDFSAGHRLLDQLTVELHKLEAELALTPPE